MKTVSEYRKRDNGKGLVQVECEIVVLARSGVLGRRRDEEGGEAEGEEKKAGGLFVRWTEKSVWGHDVTEHYFLGRVLDGEEVEAALLPETAAERA